MPRLIGFDLDMTLIDSRPGIGATYREVSRRLGVEIDIDLVTSRLGPPLELELAHWLPDEEVPAAVALYRSIYPDLAIQSSPALPGAHQALADLRDRGHRTFVLTAKHAGNARLHVEHLGLDIDDVVGDAWREGKADVLRERSADAYVGDHVHDMEAGRSAGLLTIGVTTGPCSATELRDAGADHVVTSLLQVPDLIDGHDDVAETGLPFVP